MVRVGRFLRDRAYDTVFEIGDTSLQFIGDMFRGYNENRHQAFAHRTISRREKQSSSKISHQKPRPEKPLSFDQKRSFALGLIR